MGAQIKKESVVKKKNVTINICCFLEINSLLVETEKVYVLGSEMCFRSEVPKRWGDIHPERLVYNLPRAKSLIEERTKRKDRKRLMKSL